MESMPTPYHHTYVMKLFDRSVDLAKFEEDTPLYPICRAWMQNQPRNPQVIVKYVLPLLGFLIFICVSLFKIPKTAIPFKFSYKCLVKNSVNI